MTHGAAPEAAPPRPAWGELALLGLFTALAAGLRFYHLDTLPPGFHHDEAFEAVEALKILAGGYHPIFFAGNFGVEPAFIYLTALGFKLFGVSPTVMRGMAALIGTLTVPALYWVGVELERVAGHATRGLGLLAAAVLAALYWHLTFSRIGIEPALVPLDAILALVFTLRGLRRGRWVDFAASGLFVGLSPYTYPAGRLLPFLVVGFIFYLALFQHERLRARWKGLLLLGGVALLVTLPLGITFARQPELLTLRTQQVASFGARDAWINLWDTAKAFSFAGDQDPRSNLPGRPLLDPILSFFFYAGLLLACWRWRDTAGGLLLLWLGAMLVPTILSEYAPHFRRALGAAPAVALLVALPAAAALGRLTRSQQLRVALMGLLLIGYAASAALTVRDYFVRWANSPELFYAFDVGLADVAQRIAQEPADQAVYLTPRSPDHPTLTFFLRNTERGSEAVAHFDGRHCFVLPPAGAAARYWVVEYEDWRSAALVERYLPDARPEQTILDRRGEVYARSYLQPAGGTQRAEPANLQPARFGDEIELVGWEAVNPVVRPGETLYLDLFWQPLRSMSQSYTVFVHLLGEYNPATAGPMWAGVDSLPGAGSYPTMRWLPGQRIVDEVQVPISAEMPAGEYQVEVGWYDLATMARLPAVDGRGQTVADHLILGTITVP